jgi:putative FmdB family regulatory protein
MMYDFRCMDCGRTFEANASVAERDIPRTSPCCDEPAARLMSRPQIQVPTRFAWNRAEFDRPEYGRMVDKRNDDYLRNKKPTPPEKSLTDLVNEERLKRHAPPIIG